LAEYRNRDGEFRAAGVEVAALSVDPPAASEQLRRELRLPFPILCDPERRLIASWGLLNPHERGGIACPAVFVLDPGRRVRFRSLDGTAARVHTGSLLEFLRVGDGSATAKAPRKVPIFPGWMDWWRGIRNHLGNRKSS